MPKCSGSQLSSKCKVEVSRVSRLEGRKNLAFSPRSQTGCKAPLGLLVNLHENT